MTLERPPLSLLRSAATGLAVLALSAAVGCGDAEDPAMPPVETAPESAGEIEAPPEPAPAEELASEAPMESEGLELEPWDTEPDMEEELLPGAEETLPEEELFPDEAASPEPDFAVEDEFAPEAEMLPDVAAPPAGPSVGVTHTVVPGDSLTSIAADYYGDSARYMEIYEANRDKLASPNAIKLGQELYVP